MKIALIGDVHGNLSALEAVLSDMAEKEVDIVISTGDYMGYGPDPEEVVQLLRHIEVMGVAGNYDLKVIKAEQKLKKKGRKKNPKRWDPFLWDLSQLSPEAKGYIEHLPMERRFSICGKRFLLTHGSPEKINEALRPDTPETRFAELAKSTGANVIITGHSHIVFSRKVNGTWFVNPGSVGRPVDGDPRASYAVLQIKPGYFHFSPYRVEYDVEKTVETMVKKGFPRSRGAMFIQGKSPEEAVFPEEPETASRKNPIPDPNNIQDPNDFDREILVSRAMAFMEQNAPVHVPHCRQVTKLALSLFEQLSPLHGLGTKGRTALELAGQLHDIGWVEGQKAHHKTALRMISEAKDLIPDDGLRMITASIARYHRKADPAVKHGHFQELSEKERDMVRKLSAILRIADGMDWEHLDNVRDIHCRIEKDSVTLYCRVEHPSEEEKMRTLEKGSLFEKVFERRLSISWELV